MLMPRRTKFRRSFRGHRRGAAHSGNTVVFGEWGLQAQTTAWVDARQIESARRAITGTLRRGGKVWIRIFPQHSYTKKPLEVRIGSGKAGVEGWVAVIKPATVLFEVDGVPEAMAKEGFRLAAAKLCIKTRFISRHKHA